MNDEPPRDDLTTAEAEARALAAQLLERLAYDPPEAAPGRVRDARRLARGALDLAAALEAERSARRALQARCDEQQAILGRKAYNATEAEP